MASGSEADARDAELAALPGEKLVDLLSTTYRRTDFEAVARVVKARDRRFAEVKAALADIDALRKKHEARRRPRDEAEEIGISSRDPVHRDEPRVEADIDALRKKHEARRRPRDEPEEVAPLLGISSRDPVHRDEPRVEDVPLSRRVKRPRRFETSAWESGKSNSVGTLANYVQKSTPARPVHSVAPKERAGQLVVGSTSLPKDPKERTGAVEPEKFGRQVPRTVPPFSPGLLDRNVLPGGSSQSDHGRGTIGKKRSSSDGILGPPPKGIGNFFISTRSMMKSSSRSANKDSGAGTMKCPSLSRQTEGWMVAKGRNPIQETRMVASPSLSIRSLSTLELRAYCLKPELTPPASSSCMEITTQNFHDLANQGNGLTKKPVDVSSKKKLVGGD